MRTDMAQLLVETPRYDSGEKYREHRRKANRKPEEALAKQGMRRPYFARKDFSEYLNPLKGFLRKSVGRPWDKVFSELNSALHGGGTVIEHVKVHLWNYVTRDPVWIDGKPHHPDHIAGKLIWPLKEGDYYVDRQGILRMVKPRKTPKPVRQVLLVFIDEHSAFKKIDGIWFRIWFKTLPYGQASRRPVYDIVLKKLIYCQATDRDRLYWRWFIAGSTYEAFWTLRNAYGREDRYVYRKEQVSKREIQRAGLNEKKAA
jgi:hypothetical protein